MYEVNSKTNQSLSPTYAQNLAIIVLINGTWTRCTTPKTHHSHVALMYENIGVHQGNALWILGGDELCWAKHSLREGPCGGSDAMAVGCPEVGASDRQVCFVQPRLTPRGP